MKKIFSIAILFASATWLTSCSPSEEDDIFNGSAAERLMDSKKTYTERLGGTTWAMEFYPLNSDEAPEGVGYLILNRFFKDGSVDQAMKNAISGNAFVRDTSLWELVTDMGPVLSFNTYNQCIHSFSNPGIYTTGQGYQGDYEFRVISLDENADYAMLKGKKRGTYIRLTRLPDDTDFESYLNDVQQFQNTVFAASAPNNCLLRAGDTTMVVTNASSGIISMYPYGGDPISQTTDHAYMITQHDGKYYFRFREKLTFGEASVQEMAFDAEQDKFLSVDGASNSIEGLNPNLFYAEAMEGGHKWQLPRTAEMSESVKALYEEMYNSFRRFNSNYTLQNIQFNIILDDKSADKGKLRMDISYRVRTSTAHLQFYYDLTYGAEGVTISNRQPQGNAQTVMGSISGIEPFLNVIEGSFVVSPAASSFNLTTIKLTSASDANNSFVISFIN